jgi:hypothetical protein
MLVTDWTGQLAGERVADLHRQAQRQRLARLARALLPMPIRPEHAAGVCDAREARGTPASAPLSSTGLWRASTARSSRCPPAGGADPRGWPMPTTPAPATLEGEVDLPGGAGSRPEIHRLSEQTVGILQPPKELP